MGWDGDELVEKREWRVGTSDIESRMWSEMRWVEMCWVAKSSVSILEKKEKDGLFLSFLRSCSAGL